MPAWIRKSINKITKSVPSVGNVIVETDPTAITEIAAADEQKGYLNIEVMGANVTADLYRWEGARADLLRRLDPPGTPILQVTGGGGGAGVYELPWPTGTAGAARKVTVELTATVAQEITFELDDVFRTVGG